MKSQIRARLAELERKLRSARCRVCGGGGALPMVDATWANMDSPEDAQAVEREVERVELKRCDACGKSPKISVIIVTVLPKRAEVAA